jgi:hypothetical protein
VPDDLLAAAMAAVDATAVDASTSLEDTGLQRALLQVRAPVL